MVALKAKFGVAMQAGRGYRASAVRFVADLEKSTRIFDATPYGYAREIISDTQGHEARTVGGLLAFMRKYRLMFAPAEGSPDVFALYAGLYDLLGKQAYGLGLKSGGRLTGTGLAPIRQFNGRDLSGWNGWRGKDPVDPATICRYVGEDLVWAAENGGRILVDRPYSDVALAFEFRVDGRTLNANGILELAASEAYRLGQSDVRVSQLNLPLLDGATAKAGDIVPVDHQTRRPGAAIPARSYGARRPDGEWNEAEVRLEGRLIRLLINGREVNRVEANRPVVCSLGLQANGTDIRYRNIRLTPLKVGGGR